MKIKFKKTIQSFLKWKHPKNWLVLFFILQTQIDAQQKNNFISGEELDYKTSFKIFDAAYTSMRITEDKKNNLFTVGGYGKSTGTLRFFCAIDDKYEVTLNNTTFKPIKFSRSISECGYINNITSKFNFKNKEVEIFDKKKNTLKNYPITNVTRDILSTFYYLRNLDHKKIKAGDVMKFDLIFEGSVFPTEAKILGREIIKTKFGKIRTIKTKPIVDVGRVFIKSDGVYAWVSDDENLIPLKITCELRIGTIKTTLEKHKNLKVPLTIEK